MAEAGGNHGGQVEIRPTVAALAVAGELVPVAVEAGEGAEVDHAAIVAAGWVMG
jgi:hypothetical protein